MIGIIGAMEVEIEGIVNLIDCQRRETISGIDFISGKIHSTQVVLAKCGCGKVNAAICTQTMILKYKPDIILNTGVAGGLHYSLGVCDIAVADNVVQYDFDTTALGDPLGFISSVERVQIPCAKRVCTLLFNIASSLEETTALTGTIATGDRFVNSSELSGFIKNKFNAIAADMESGAIGHVCCANKVEFGIIRAVSDSANDSSHLDYNRFMKAAADKTVSIINSFIQLY